jgi:hypothetical protein
MGLFRRELSVNFTSPLRVELGFSTPLTIVSQPPSPAPGVPILGRITAHYDGFIVSGDTHMAYTLPDDKALAVGVAWKDKMRTLQR